MKTEKKKREFIALELQKYATEVGLGELGLTDGIIKNKIDTIKKTGKRLVNSVVKKRLPQDRPTGSAAGSDEDTDCQLDWMAIEKEAKWPHIRQYYDLFGQHPTLGIGEAIDTAAIDDDQEAVTPASTGSTARQSEHHDNSCGGKSSSSSTDSSSSSSGHSSSSDGDGHTHTLARKIQRKSPKRKKSEIQQPKKKPAKPRSATSSLSAGQHQFIGAFGDIQAEQQKRSEESQQKLADQRQKFEQSVRRQERESEMHSLQTQQMFQMQMQQSMMAFQAQVLKGLFGSHRESRRRRRHGYSSSESESDGHYRRRQRDYELGRRSRPLPRALTAQESDHDDRYHWPRQHEYLEYERDRDDRRRRSQRAVPDDESGPDERYYKHQRRYPDHAMESDPDEGHFKSQRLAHGYETDPDDMCYKPWRHTDLGDRRYRKLADRVHESEHEDGRYRQQCIADPDHESDRDDRQEKPRQRSEHGDGLHEYSRAGLVEYEDNDSSDAAAAEQSRPQ